MSLRPSVPNRAARALRVALALAALAALTVTATACAGGSALDGTSWTLVGWPVSGLDPRDFTITAEFDEGRIAGTSAVNSYGGEYTAGADGAFSVGEVQQTLMAGSEEAMRAESAYHELLRGAATYRLDNTTLTLFDERGAESLVFEAASP